MRLIKLVFILFLLCILQADAVPTFYRRGPRKPAKIAAIWNRIQNSRPDAHITYYRRGPHKPAKIADIWNRIQQKILQFSNRNHQS